MLNINADEPVLNSVLELEDIHRKEVQKSQLEGLVTSVKVFSVAISPDGTMIASCSRDKTAKVFNLHTGMAPAVVPDHLTQL